MGYNAFFRKVTDVSPYPYQVRLATGAWPDLVSIPTGLGKTAAVTVAWMWKIIGSDVDTPRRLVYCLPMRVLVEQTRDCVGRWLAAATGDFNGKGIALPEVHVLMGGEDASDFDRYPEKPAVLIGTQDMLLSRALNRGYGMSRYRWPTHFGLLNNDCLWIVDEVQLMGSGLSTTVQLQTFRNKFGTVKNTRTVWMSATADPNWFGTVDFEPATGLANIRRLATADEASDIVARRLSAKKPFSKSVSTMDDATGLAKEVLEAHVGGSRTLVVLNTVKRATALYAAIKKRKPEAMLVLIHSRFRPVDRRAAVEAMLRQPAEAGTIIVSTQVVEAGVDVSAKTLFTELCPWPSLVQRFGRCNRSGEYPGARVFWIDAPENVDRFTAPYEPEEMASGRAAVLKLDDVGIASLPTESMHLPEGCVLRRKDLIDLFDTTASISGLDIDVSRFIREASEHDVQVYWREVDRELSIPEESMPDLKELCSVPIGDLRALVKEKKYPWRWSALSGEWERCVFPESILPGGLFLLPADFGCYTEEEGWSLDSEGKVHVFPSGAFAGNDSNEADEWAQGGWKDIATHTEEVRAVLAALCSSIGIPEACRGDLLTAGRWHDAGKAHAAFQAKIRPDALADAPVRPVAKAPKEAWVSGRVPIASSAGNGRRPHFRHELVSGLLALAHGKSDLAAYLAAAHHGKVRLSIRSLPNEIIPGKDVRFARGVWEGDIVPSVDLAGGETSPETAIDLGLMEVGRIRPGQPSWGERMAALRDSESVGPFRLGFLEALIKVADERASGGGR